MSRLIPQTKLERFSIWLCVVFGHPLTRWEFAEINPTRKRWWCYCGERTEV